MFLISGNVGKEAEVKTLPSGKIVVEYSVAVYAGKDQSGNSQTLWVKCSHWFNQQPNDYLVPKKGDGVVITGTPSPIRIWDSNGKQGAELGIMVNTIEYSKRAEAGQSQAAQQQAQTPPPAVKPVYQSPPPLAADDSDLSF